ncbi:MAG: chromophore lyase CpcT/CpeT, partial [Myxococcota bacterium]
DRVGQARDWLAGRFDSSAQAAADSDYLSIQLAACAIEAPELGEQMLYVEQAVATRPASPYRQRLYAIEAGDSPSRDVVSTVYELVDPEAAVGTCDLDDTATFAAADARLREGCEVYLSWSEGRFVGGTRGEGCESRLDGARYATSEVELTADRLESWDRGFDGAGTQVWGVTAGPYVFLRQ